MNVEENKNIFGKEKMKCRTRIQKLRKKRNISLKALSAQSGVSVEWLKLLDQHVLPEDMLVDHVIRLAQALNCRPHELFE